MANALGLLGLGETNALWTVMPGDGTILTMEGSGPEAKLTVYFDRIGSKKFIARYAKLIRI